MLIQLLFLIILLFLLFFLTRRISSTIYNCIYLVTLNQTFAIGVLTFILLPGTIIHELSHFLAATLIRVQTGELSILPEIEKNGEVKAGKLMLGTSDPFRHSIIGLAPIFTGITLIYVTGRLFFTNFQLFTFNFQLIIGLYLLFIVSITMFSSKKDIESLIISVPILILIFISLYTIGVRILLDVNLIRKMDLFLSDINRFLFIAALSDYIIFVLLTCNNTLIEKILGRKIVYK